MKNSVRRFSSLPESDNFLPVIAILTAVLLWGGSFAAMKVSVSSLNPWAVMWIRMFVALLFIMPFFKKLIPKSYKKGDWKLLIPLVLFQPCLYFLLESNALRYTTSSQAGIITASTPAMVSVFAWMMIAERVRKQTIIGLIISITGVICLTLIQNPTTIAQNPMIGNAMELLAMTSAALAVVLVKQLSQRYNTWTLTGLQVLAGSLFFSPGIFYVLDTSFMVWSKSLVLILFFLGAMVTLGAFGLYNWGISQIPASQASVFLYLVPVNAVIIGWIMLDESLTFLQCITVAIVILGVWISQRAGSFS
ncbi:MAG: EamA family transporter [Aliifodinibius sp.]|nr:DMT family transporter [Fodinibius sp.]NIW44455.1 EamA family transporter [Gammaproteobacteria bacterium]NIX56277.1 EamA family transporter [candidate division Zixibacteria bacterium]NIY24977.1 EamA family transporter [Fodinibius sp.]